MSRKIPLISILVFFNCLAFAQRGIISLNLRQMDIATVNIHGDNNVIFYGNELTVYRTEIPQQALDEIRRGYKNKVQSLEALLQKNRADKEKKVLELKRIQEETRTVVKQAEQLNKEFQSLDLLKQSVLYKKAKEAFDRGQFDQALELISEIHLQQEDRKLADLRRLRGRLHAIQYNFDKADADFDRMLELWESYQNYHEVIDYRLWDRNTTRGVDVLLEKAIRLADNAEDSSNVFNFWGHYYGKKNDLLGAYDMTKRSYLVRKKLAETKYKNAYYPGYPSILASMSAHYSQFSMNYQSSAMLIESDRYLSQFDGRGMETKDYLTLLESRALSYSNLANDNYQFEPEKSIRYALLTLETVKQLDSLKGTLVFSIHRLVLSAYNILYSISRQKGEDLAANLYLDQTLAEINKLLPLNRENYLPELSDWYLKKAEYLQASLSFAEAGKHFRQCEAILDSLESIIPGAGLARRSQLLNNWIFFFTNTGQFDAAEEKSIRLAVLIEKMGTESAVKGGYYTWMYFLNLGINNSNTGNYDEAILYLEKASKELESYGSKYPEELLWAKAVTTDAFYSVYRDKDFTSLSYWDSFENYMHNSERLYDALYQREPLYFGANYAQLLTSIGECYNRAGENKAISQSQISLYYERADSIIGGLYFKHPDYFSASYVNFLRDYQYYLFGNGENNKALGKIEEALRVLNLMKRQNGLAYNDLYSRFIASAVTILLRTEKEERALSLLLSVQDKYLKLKEANALTISVDLNYAWLMSSIASHYLDKEQDEVALRFYLQSNKIYSNYLKYAPGLSFSFYTSNAEKITEIRKKCPDGSCESVFLEAKIESEKRFREQPALGCQYYVNAICELAGYYCDLDSIADAEALAGELRDLLTTIRCAEGDNWLDDTEKTYETLKRIYVQAGLESRLVIEKRGQKRIYAPDGKPAKLTGNAFIHHYLVDESASTLKYYVTFAEKNGKISTNCTCFISEKKFENGIAEFNIAGKEGLIDSTGKLIIPPAFDYIISGKNSAYGDLYFEVGLSGKKGLMDRNGNEIFPLKYWTFEKYPGGEILAADTVSTTILSANGGKRDFQIPVNAYFSDKIFKSPGNYYFGPQGILCDKALGYEYYSPRDITTETSGGNRKIFIYSVKYMGLASTVKRYGLRHADGNMIAPPKYEEADYLSDSLFSLRLYGKYGVLDHKGKTILPFQYQRLISKYGDKILAKQGGKCGVFSATGAELIPPVYEDINLLTSNLASIKENGKYGLIHISGKIIASPAYDRFRPFQEGMAAIQQNGKYGFIDSTGKLIVKPSFEDVCDYNGGLAFARQNTRWGMIDKTGNQVMPPKYDSIYLFAEGMAVVRKSGKFGIINTGGVEIAQPVYDAAGRFFGETATVIKNKKQGKINRKGELITPLEYDQIWLYAEGMAIVKSGNKYGYIDSTGKLAIPLTYDSCSAFSLGSTVAYKDGIPFLIDKTGRTLNAVPYQHIGDFEEGLAAVGTNGKYGFINASGIEVMAPIYEKAISFKDGRGMVVQSKWGLVDSNGVEKSPFIYDKIYPFASGYAVAIKDNKYGYLDAGGRELTRFEYDSACAFSNGIGVVCREGRCGGVNTSGRLTIPVEYDSVVVKMPGWAVISAKGKSGLTRPDGRQLTVPEYDKIWGITEGVAVVWNSGSGFGFVDTTGVLLIPPQYEKATYFKDGVAFVSIGGKWGAIDKAGKLIAPAVYEDMRTFDRGLASVKAGGKWGRIDKAGRLVVPAIYEEIYKCDAGLSAAVLDGKWGYMDTTGKMVIAAEYDGAGNFDHGMASVKAGGKWGKIDKAGRLVVPAIYDRIDNFEDGLAAVVLGGKWGFIDTTGKLVIPAKYDGVSDFKYGLASVREGEEWGKVDKTGRVVVPVEYDKVYIMREGMAAVKKGKKYGFVNAKGIEVVPPVYDLVSTFSGGVAKIKKKGSYGLIDTTGGEIAAAEYDRMSDLSGNGSISVKIDDNFGRIDRSGKVMIPLEYSEMRQSGQTIIVKKNQNFGFMDAAGRELAPPGYEEIDSLGAGMHACRKNIQFLVINKGGAVVKKYGFNDFNSIKRLKDGNFFIYKGNFMGMLDTKGEMLLLPEYTQIKSDADGVNKKYFAVKENRHYFNYKGRRVR